MGELIYAHVRSGSLWIALENSLPQLFSGDPREFFCPPRRFRVRLVADAENLGLLEQIYDVTSEWPKIELTGPTWLRSAKDSIDRIFLRLRGITAASSTGGWHSLRPGEWLSYLLAKLFTGRPEVVREKDVSTMLANHPAWPALSILPGISILPVARLLAEIVDPRYFIDPEHPHRRSRLEAYLGLVPRGARTSPAQRRRREIVAACWRRSAPPPQDIFRAPYFLWRVASEFPDSDRGFLRADQHFIAYLRHTWMDALYRKSTNRGSDRLFEPDLFFTSAESIWYESAMASVGKKQL